MKIDKILITDDHVFVIEGIIAVLNDKFLVDSFVLCTSPEEALKVVKKEKADLYILDLGFRSEKKRNIDIRELNYIRKIGQMHTDAKIIIFTMREDFGLVSILQKVEQVKGIVFKGPKREYLQQAVESVMNNQSYLCPRFKDLQEKYEEYRCKSDLKLQKLTILPSDQRIKILELLAKGYLSKQIAVELNLSLNTVESYRKDLRKLFHTYTTNDTIVLALLLNYINLDDLAEDLLDRLD